MLSCLHESWLRRNRLSQQARKAGINSCVPSGILPNQNGEKIGSQKTRMYVIVLASQKGGVGKTTLAAHLAVIAEAAGDGPAVLIDTDPQGSLSAWWNVREANSPALAPTTIAE